MQRVETLQTMLQAIYDYATKAIPLNRTLEPALIMSASIRPEPLRHIYRPQFLMVMLSALYDNWRTTEEQNNVFNAACYLIGRGATGGEKQTEQVAKSVRTLGVTPTVADKLGV
jgi:hypothetical protein